MNGRWTLWTTVYSSRKETAIDELLIASTPRMNASE